jgi:hypothetical protein
LLILSLYISFVRVTSCFAIFSLSAGAVIAKRFSLCGRERFNSLAHFTIVDTFRFVFSLIRSSRILVDASFNRRNIDTGYKIADFRTWRALYLQPCTLIGRVYKIFRVRVRVSTTLKISPSRQIKRLHRITARHVLG